MEKVTFIIGKNEELGAANTTLNGNTIVLFSDLIGVYKTGNYRQIKALKYKGSYRGTTEERLSGVDVGFQYFDTTLNKPIWWNGTAWVDATGAEV